MSTPGLYGLVLAGGASTRMQRDKAALLYHGKPQLQWTFDLLSEVCERVFVSVRPDQTRDPVRAGLPQIVDRQTGQGPIAGIAAAQQAHPEVGWLVVACDLPFLSRATLDHLLAHRDPARSATAYRSAHDSLPEPLCAIYEPAALSAIDSYIAAGKHCPRKFLASSDANLIEQPDPRALDNINTVEEHHAAARALGG
jgi:molybdopterin-guanine dinucleotide biosynthesis protein A